MNPQSNYEKARDEAAYEVEKIKELICLVPKPEAIKNNSMFLSDHETSILCGCELRDIFKTGSDFGRSYEQRLNADLLADCKAMKQALELISSPSEWNCEIGESNQRAAAVKTLSQLKGKHDE